MPTRLLRRNETSISRHAKGSADCISQGDRNERRLSFLVFVDQSIDAV